MQMIPSFPGFPLNSRVWIFQSNRFMDAATEEKIHEIMKAFLNDWTSHNQRMHAQHLLFRNYFLVVALNEEMAGASGCGIDKLVRAVQAAGQATGTDFFDRSNIVAMQDGKAELLPINECNNRLGADSGVYQFHNIQTLADLDSFFVPASKSWISARLNLSA